MVPKRRLYKVTTGYIHKEGYDKRWASENILALDAEEAIIKYRDKLAEKEVIESVELIATVDIE